MLLTRWQAIHLLDAVWFYRMLTIHGMSMLIFFIIFFEMAVLYFASAVLLNSRLPAPKTGWAAFALMVIGALMVEWTMFTGQADVPDNLFDLLPGVAYKIPWSGDQPPKVIRCGNLP